MDRKLSDFYDAARRNELLDDTLLIVTSDHGEAFGEHGLYLHDASTYHVNLHVPLWVQHPDRAPQTVDDVVTTRDLFGLMHAAALGDNLSATILDADYRADHPIAIAEHFYYPHVRDALPRYQENIVAALSRSQKVIVRSENVEHYLLTDDPDETTPTGASVLDFAAACRREGAAASAVDEVVSHLRNWNTGARSSSPLV